MEDLTAKQLSALERVKRKPELEPWLFKKVDSLVWFDAFSSAGYFDPSLNPAPVEKEGNVFNIPFWPVTDYLFSSSVHIKNTANLDLAGKYLNLIECVTQHAIGNGFSNYRTWYQFSKILRNLPESVFEAKHAEMIRYWLQDKFEVGIVSNELCNWMLELLCIDDNRSFKLALLAELFTPQKIVNNRGAHEKSEARLYLKTYGDDNLIEAIASKVGSNFCKEGLDLLFNKLREVVAIVGGDEYSYMWRSAIEEHEQNQQADDAEDFIVVACREALLAYIKVEGKDASQYVEKLLTDKLSIIRRVALYAYGLSVNELGCELVDILIDELFLTANYKHEMWWLLRKNFAQFSAEQKEKLHALIDGIVNEENPNSAIYIKSGWYDAIKKQDRKALGLYQNCIAITGITPEHPDFSSYMSTWSHEDEISPISRKEFTTIYKRDGAGALVELLNSYESPKSPMEPGLESLVREFKLFVIDECESVFKDFQTLKQLKLPFIYELIQAYSKLWSDEKMNILPWVDIWPEIIGLAEYLFFNDAFWGATEETNEFVGRTPWVVAGFCRFIEAGCKNDGMEFPYEYIEPILAILIRILEKQPPSNFDKNSDAVSVAINSPRGQCIEALVNLALFACRKYKTQKDKKLEKWTLFEWIFDQELEVKNNYEFYTLIPRYISNMYFLSEKWVDESFDKLLKDDHEVRWLCALQGFSGNNTLYPRLYDYLKQPGVYERVLDSEFIKKNTSQRYLDFGVLKYSVNKEKMEDKDSLISRLLGIADFDSLRRLVWIFHHGFAKNKNAYEHIRELWPIISSKSDMTTIEGRKLASVLCEWSEYLLPLDEITKGWLLAVVPYAEIEHNAQNVLDSLVELSDLEPSDTLDIWGEMISVECPYPYPEKTYKDLFISLLNQGYEVQLKSQIVDKYLSYGVDSPFTWLQEVKQEVENV